MEAILSVVVSLLFLGLLFWSVNSLSVLRLQMDEVLAKLERLERAGKSDPSRGAS